MFTNNVYVTVNGFPLHGTDSNGSEWIVNQTDGFLDGAPSTLATTQKIWSHGVFTNQPFYGGRVVSLEGYVRGTTTENAILSWDALKQALSLNTQDVIIDWRGYKRLLRGKQSGQPLVEWFDKYTLKFSLEFTSNTPFLYSAGGALSGSTYLPSASGGMTFPYAFEGDGTVNLSTRWTGTADASTSTLSQNGQVVATNLLTSPRTLTGYIVKWGNKDNVSLQTDDNGDTYLHIVGNGSSTFVVAFPGVDRPDISTACVQARSNININRVNVNNQGTSTLTGDGMWHYLQVTNSKSSLWTPTGTVFGCEYSLKDGEYLDFKMPALFSPSDFQAMQALGVDWFDGDSYPNDWGFPEESTSGSITLNSNGTASSPVIITISGYVVNPRIEHRQTGAVLALNYTIPVGETVVLNSETREVLINGKIPSQQIVSSRQWFNAGPGENTFMFSADDGDQNTATISMEMREAWL